MTRRLLVPTLLFLVACGAPAAATPDAEDSSDIVAAPDASAPDAAPDAPPAVSTACTPDVPRTSALELSVEPDAGATPFTSVLSRATKSIKVLIYELGTGPIIDAIESKARAGLKVEMILDVGQKRTNQKYMDRLVAAGANVIWSDPQFSYMHAKVLIVDEAEAVVSTGNYADFRMKVERNYAVHDSDPSDIASLVTLFDADFARKTPDLTCTRLLVSPVNSKQRLLDFLHAAKKEIVVESMQLADSDVRQALVERREAGVAVWVLLADPSWISANADAAAYLAQHGIIARRLSSPALHVKSVVVDSSIAYAGSINLSYTSFTKNREVGLLVTEPANVTAVHDTFEKDWAAAATF